MGLMQRGNRAAARLTATQVIEIRQRYDSGESQGALARRFQVAVNTIGKIVRRENWTWLKDAEQAQEITDPPPVFRHTKPFPEINGTLERLIKVQQEVSGKQGINPLDEGEEK